MLGVGKMISCVFKDIAPIKFTSAPTTPLIAALRLVLVSSFGISNQLQSDVEKKLFRCESCLPTISSFSARTFYSCLKIRRSDYKSIETSYVPR